MYRTVKCKVLLNSQFVKKHCPVFAYGHHCTPNLKSAAQTSIKSKCQSYQSVADFYAGRSIFLTGGTGFLGKIFLERLLSNCSEIEKIYVLIRPKKGVPVDQRLQDLLENPVFTTLKNNKPGHLNKIVPIAGDISESKLGLKPEDEQTLLEKVSVVFHSAADVKFSEPLKTSLDINFEGTKKVIHLSQQMKNLEIFVHISSAYSNSDRIVIEEMIYPPPRKFDEVYNFMKTHRKDDEETEKFIRGHLNYYSFSKALAESYLEEYRKNMRSIIVRPSIDEILVYNSCSSSTNPITWMEAANLFAKNRKKFQYDELPFPTVMASDSPMVVKTVTFLLQTIPSFIADAWLRVTGRKPKYMKLQPRAVLLRDILRTISGANFLIKSDRAQELIASLDENDRQRFICDPKTINWKEYMPTYSYGVKQFLLRK